MSGEFAEHGKAILARGYLPVPIAPGTKRPSIPAWENFRATTTTNDLGRFSGHGLGILCGQGDWPIAALDVDSVDPALVAEFTQWCRRELGPSCERIGAPPKTLLVYRSAEPWRKQSSVWLANGSAVRHRLEILGNGQQFVAYAIHPTTRQPYRWVDPYGGLEYLDAGALPVINAGQASAAIQTFQSLAAARGYQPASKAPAAIAAASAGDIFGEQPLGLSIPQIRDLLDFIPGADDYDTWIRVGLAVHCESGGSDDGMELWNEWSAKAANYSGWESCAAKWASFEREVRKLTGQWLRARANEYKKSLSRQERDIDLATVLQKISGTKHSDELLNEIASYAGVVAKRDLSLQIQIEAAIKTKFEQLTGTKITASQVRAALRAPRADAELVPAIGPVISYPLNQAGNADRMIARYGKNLMYALGLGWYKWTGATWVKADTIEIEHLAYETVRALPEEFTKLAQNAEVAKELQAFASMSQSVSMVEAMAKLVTLTSGLTVRADQLDRNRSLIGCTNGTIDLATGLLLPADRSHRITMSTHLEYQPDIKSELWELTVLQALGNNVDMLTFLQRLMGYALLGTADEDVLAIPYGMGCNGKSTIFNTLRLALGDYGRMASANTFVHTSTNGGSGGTAREDILRLRNARMVYVTEPNEDSILKEDVVKSMTGGEPIPARGLYERSSVEVAPTWLCVLPTNHKPLIKGDDYGIWRRLLPIAFNVNFDEDLRFIKDPQREEKLADELPAVLAWCVRGALDYQLHGFLRPAPVQRAAADYRRDMDLLGEWIAECCVVGPGHKASAVQLWSSWRIWAEPRGELKLISSMRLLDRRLRARYPLVNREFVGIAPKSEWI